MEPLCERFSTTTFDANGQLAGFSLHYEDNFNFGYDVVDAIAKEEPQKRAVQWCDEQGAEKMLTFGEISRLSNKAAGVFKALGIGKGDRVLVMLDGNPSGPIDVRFAQTNWFRTNLYNGAEIPALPFAASR